jgi:type II secretory pathway pseudopilin PulG
MMNEDMSKQNPKNHTDLIWQTHMQTLTKRKRNMEIAQTIDNALEEYYSEKGQPVPLWRMKKNPDWWIEYLRELENYDS